VTISVVVLTLLGTLYVLAVTPPLYQAKANVLLVSPTTAPTDFEIAQNPALAKMNNPYVNLGNPTYIADVMATLVGSRGDQQSLEAAGVSPGYQVTVDASAEASGQTVAPPALDITGVGSTAQAAIQSAELVADAVSSDLRQLQQSQHVQSNFMITAVEYVTPSSAVGSSSGKLKTALMVAVVGVIALFVAVSAAQALEERRNGRPGQGQQPDSRVGARREPVGALADSRYGEPRGQYGETQHREFQYGEPQYAAPQRGAGCIDDSRFAGPTGRQGVEGQRDQSA
jgi:hypothetical protein